MQLVSNFNGHWQALTKQWEEECQNYGENFEDYAAASMPILEELASSEPTNRAAGVYAATDGNGKYIAACHANCSHLPGYDGKVLRIRHITFSPDFDFGDSHVLRSYEDALVSVFVGTISLSFNEMKARHIKFHLRSFAEIQFAHRFTEEAEKDGNFKEVKMKGAWIYLSKT
ncbi:hypothetical protein AQS8620_01286 [Aquimixticola soesokkakensis]|uniref:Uncharacterized protein n=1 Tax=Aquimixticola soesokkakensis TaxID=1519096 RepID=A0A1Y5SAU1_9RHOB|nr:hypothetical protein [Aquimixticola soesokkakensis]SLN36174.1 hypothetical protein AQS8620_01286 [Aquimixticola soesokkakensis]